MIKIAFIVQYIRLIAFKAHKISLTEYVKIAKRKYLMDLSLSQLEGKFGFRAKPNRPLKTKKTMSCLAVSQPSQAYLKAGFDVEG